MYTKVKQRKRFIHVASRETADVYIYVGARSVFSFSVFKKGLNSDFERLFRFYSINLLFFKFEWFPISGRYCSLVSSLITSQHVFSPRHVCNAVEPKWNIIEFLTLLYFLLPHSFLAVDFICNILSKFCFGSRKKGAFTHSSLKITVIWKCSMIWETGC